jgi:lysozyme
MRKPASELKLGSAGLRLIKEFESHIGYPYDDLVVRGGKYPEWKGGPLKGTLTIGYGHTNLSGFPPTIVPGMRMTEAEASLLLSKVLAAVYEPAVRRLVKVPLSQNEYDALVSFCYNCGAGNLSRSTLLKRLNAGDYAGAAQQFMAWTRSKGIVLRGLVRRRQAEAALFSSKARTEFQPSRAPEAAVGTTIAVTAGGAEAARQSGVSTEWIIAGVVLVVAIGIGFAVWRARK